MAGLFKFFAVFVDIFHGVFFLQKMWSGYAWCYARGMGLVFLRTGLCVIF